MIEYFQRGGPVMWPLLMCSLLSLAFALERIWFWIRIWRREQPDAVSRALQLVGDGRREEALKVCAGGRDYVLSMFHEGLRAGGPHTSLFVALDQASSERYILMKKYLTVFETIISLSPLLGIFGTVVGIVFAFDALGGNVDNVSQVASGVSQALITTVFGLAIAMPTLIFYNFFQSQVTRARHRMESALSNMEIAIHESEENRTRIGKTEAA
ncbi:MotA/TolQ/ExbB proton channel family protein [bacterium]|nr:MotA/TolQ/ExbB proton channel family protein [bacterium]